MVKTTWIMPLLSMLSHAFAERYIIHGVQQHSGSPMSLSTRTVVHGYLIIEVNGELPSRNFLREGRERSRWMTEDLKTPRHVRMDSNAPQIRYRKTVDKLPRVWVVRSPIDLDTYMFAWAIAQPPGRVRIQFVESQQGTPLTEALNPCVVHPMGATTGGSENAPVSMAVVAPSLAAPSPATSTPMCGGATAGAVMHVDSTDLLAYVCPTWFPGHHFDGDANGYLEEIALLAGISTLRESISRVVGEWATEVCQAAGLSTSVLVSHSMSAVIDALKGKILDQTDEEAAHMMEDSKLDDPRSLDAMLHAESVLLPPRNMLGSSMVTPPSNTMEGVPTGVPRRIDFGAEPQAAATPQGSSPGSGLGNSQEELDESHQVSSSSPYGRDPHVRFLASAGLTARSINSPIRPGRIIYARATPTPDAHPRSDPLASSPAGIDQLSLPAWLPQLMGHQHAVGPVTHSFGLNMIIQMMANMHIGNTAVPPTIMGQLPLAQVTAELKALLASCGNEGQAVWLALNELVAGEHLNPSIVHGVLVPHGLSTGLGSFVLPTYLSAQEQEEVMDNLRISAHYSLWHASLVRVLQQHQIAVEPAPPQLSVASMTARHFDLISNGLADGSHPQIVFGAIRAAMQLQLVTVSNSEGMEFPIELPQEEENNFLEQLGYRAVVTALVCFGVDRHPSALRTLREAANQLYGLQGNEIHFSISQILHEKAKARVTITGPGASRFAAHLLTLFPNDGRNKIEQMDVGTIRNQGFRSILWDPEIEAVFDSTVDNLRTLLRTNPPEMLARREVDHKAAQAQAQAQAEAHQDARRNQGPVSFVSARGLSKSSVTGPRKAPSNLAASASHNTGISNGGAGSSTDLLPNNGGAGAPNTGLPRTLSWSPKRPNREQLLFNAPRLTEKAAAEKAAEKAAQEVTVP